MRRNVLALFPIMISVLVPAHAQWTGGILSSPFEAINIPNAPFSATDTMETTGLDGNPVKGPEEIVYLSRDSAGRTRVEMHLFKSSQLTVVEARIFDPVAGYWYEVFPASKRFRQQTWAPPVPLGVTSQPEPQIKIPMAFPGIVYTNPIMDGAVAGIGQAEGHFKTAWELLPEQPVEGVAAEGIRLMTTIEAGAAGNVNETMVEHVKWVSRELRITLFDSLSDPRFGRRVRRLTDVRTAEPDPALFVVPPEYVEQR